MTQNELLLVWLRKYGSITPLEALNEIGIFRLAARVSDLRAEGHDIQTSIVQAGKKHYARYVLVEPTQASPW